MVEVWGCRVNNFTGFADGDIVTLVDGATGTVVNTGVCSNDRVRVQFAVESPHHDHQAYRIFCLDGTHVCDELPAIKSITKPGASTMSTPYDTEIANAEKALADLRAKAIAEAERTKKPVLADGQRWKTRGGDTVTITPHLVSSASRVRFIGTDGYWRYEDGTAHTGAAKLELVELLPPAPRRWYTVEEALAFKMSPSGILLTRHADTKAPNGYARLYIATDSVVLFSAAETDIKSHNFTQFEFTRDNVTWHKFGVEE